LQTIRLNRGVGISRIHRQRYTNNHSYQNPAICGGFISIIVAGKDFMDKGLLQKEIWQLRLSSGNLKDIDSISVNVSTRRKIKHGEGYHAKN